MKFIPPAKALWTNFTEALGFCASQLPNIDFNRCVNPTNDPEILNLDSCGIKDKEGRSKCDPDGVRDDAARLQAALILNHFFAFAI